MLTCLLTAFLAAPASAAPPLRLSGLDRLYFTRVGEADGRLLSPSVAPLLPPRLRPPSAEADQEQVIVRDFTVPLAGWPRRVVLRQVVDARFTRISELWLAVYDGGTRSDLWHFRADPKLTEGKLLPNAAIDQIEAGADGGIAMRLVGRMDRPQGAWWAAGRVLTFTRAKRALALAHVVNTFSFTQGYDRGEEDPPVLTVATEREVAGRFERRELSPVPADKLKACGAGSPDEIDATWDEMAHIAQCLTASEVTATSSRAAGEPSFAERGGRPRE